MKKKNYTPEEIVTLLRKVDAFTAEGATVTEAAKQIGVSQQSIYRWRRQYGMMDKNEAKRLKQLECTRRELLLDAEDGTGTRTAVCDPAASSC